MAVSVKILTTIKDLLAIEDDWNRKLVDFAKNPQFFSRRVTGLMELCIAEGCKPLIFTFYSNNELVGMAAFKTRKVFFASRVFSVFDDFIIFDKYREESVNALVDILFTQMKCTSVSITINSDSPNLKVLRDVCSKRKIPFDEQLESYISKAMLSIKTLHETIFDNRAVIPIKTTWKPYFKLLSRSFRKGLRRIERKLNGFGSWDVYVNDLDSHSIEKLYSIEKNSWKSKWRKTNNIQEDGMLRIILESSKKTVDIEPITKSEIWFLEVNKIPIAYQIVIIYKGTAYFAKTSFNEKFGKLSPGKFLVYTAIREQFRKGNIKKIDFITNLPFVSVWKPLVEYRKKVVVGKSSKLLRTFLYAFIVAQMRLEKSFLKKISPIASLLKFLELAVSIE